MSQFNEVAEPIICDAYAEPTHHVPPHLMSNLRKGYVLIHNWHILYNLSLSGQITCQNQEDISVVNNRPSHWC